MKFSTLLLYHYRPYEVLEYFLFYFLQNVFTYANTGLPTNAKYLYLKVLTLQSEEGKMWNRPPSPVNILLFCFLNLPNHSGRTGPYSLLSLLQK
jgi:hypothetical protein